MWYPVGPLFSSYCVFGDIMTYFLFVCFSPWWILLRSMSFLLPFSFSFLIALVFIDFSCDSDGHDADCEEEDATCLFIWLLHVG